jgi:SAM-dependent methyltransferase
MPEPQHGFTGERLHDDEPLFGVDLLRHRAAYREAGRIARQASARRLLELGSGDGYGAAELSEDFPGLVAVDRVAPSAASRERGARFVRADVSALPLAAQRFDLALSFQVIEHLPEPRAYLEALAGAIVEDGAVLVSTPNAAFSDGENPFHVREYGAEALAALLSRHFGSVQMWGVSARGEALVYHEARLARIRSIVRLDPLGLRRHLPRPLTEWLFARAALLLRQWIGAKSRLPRVQLADFPIEPAHPRSLDLFAICRTPLRGR